MKTTEELLSEADALLVFSSGRAKITYLNEMIIFGLNKFEVGRVGGSVSKSSKKKILY